MKPRKRFIWIGVIVIGVASLGSFSYFAIMRHDRVESFTELTILDSSEGVTLQKLLSDLHGEVPFYYNWVQRRRKVSQAVLPRRWLLKVRQACMETEMRRWGAERELTHMGTNAWPALADLVDALEHRNLSVGMAAGNALAGMRADEAPDWGRLESRLQGETRPAHVFRCLLTGRYRGGTRYGVAERRFALVGLAASGAAAALAYPDVIEVLQSDEDPELRSLAVGVVGKLEAQREHSVPPELLTWGRVKMSAFVVQMTPRTAKWRRRAEPGNAVFDWLSVSHKTAIARVRCGELSGASVTRNSV